jgi:peptide/nickel transport system substrate-binding protein
LSGEEGPQKTVVGNGAMRGIGPMRLKSTALLAGLLAMAPAAMAQNVLTIGVRSEASSMDPHWTQLSADKQVEEHIFEKLVELDANSRPIPGLAVSWRPISETTWELKLREGVKWQDGEAFNADDVIFTFQRLLTGVTGAPTSPSFALVKGGKKIEKVDDYTVRIQTIGPYPTMAEDLAMFAILPEHKVKGSTPSVDFNNGKATVGTGPYRLVEYKPGDRVVLEKVENYWGEKPAWDRVVFRPITQDASRLAALMNGDVDLIDYPPTNDLPRLRGDSKFAIADIPSDRVIYIQMSFRDIEPFVKAKDGSPMKVNPLRDVRVRQAMSLAINREAIRDRIMGGSALPTANIVPPGFFGYNEALKADPFDAERAKRLLQEAGFGDGFRITLHGPNNRYINDQRIIEAIAQMWTRIGIQTEVATMPRNIFFSDVIRGDSSSIPGVDVPKFSVWLTGWGTVAGEATYTVTGLLESYNTEAGTGNANWGRYTNVRIDVLSRKARETVDPEKRLPMLLEATEIGVRDYALIPLHFQVNHWAMKGNLRLKPRVNERTRAMDVTRVQ